MIVIIIGHVSADARLKQLELHNMDMGLPETTALNPKWQHLSKTLTSKPLKP